MDYGIDVLHVDARWDSHCNGGIVQDRLDAPRDQLIHDPLRGIGWHSHDSDLDPHLLYFAWQISRVQDLETAQATADLLRVIVEHTGYVESPAFEPTIVRNCMAQVTSSHQCDVPSTVNF